jgi:hypothetical protein
MSKNSMKTLDKDSLINRKNEENSITISLNVNSKTKIIKKAEKKNYSSQSQTGKNLDNKNSLKKTGRVFKVRKNKLK